MIDNDKIDKKQFILDTAEKLFSQMGYDGTSTRTIAAHAGVNMSMLNYYFGSKDGLYKAVLDRRLDVFNQLPDDIKTENLSSWDKLYQWLDIYIENVLSDIYFHKLIHRELSLQQRSDMTDLITATLIRNSNELKRIISDGIKNGSFRNIDIELTIATIFGTEYYIINSTHMASRILNKDLLNQQVIQNEIKPRVKTHIKDLLHTHLKRAGQE